MSTVPALRKYIKKNIDYLNVNETREVLQLLMSSDINDEKIQTKGGGTQIKFSDMPKHILVSISNFIESKLKDKQQELKSIHEESEVKDV